MYGWNDRDSAIERRHAIGNEDGTIKSSVFEVGQHTVTIDGDIESIRYRRTYGQSTDPRRTLPNMEIADGEIRIPVTDLVEETLRRLDPADLARALWSESEEVRAAFMDCMRERYESGITEADRRAFLASVKEAVHAPSLDALNSKLNGLEYAARNTTHFSHQIYELNNYLRQREIKGYDGETLQIRAPDADPDFKIGGTHWDEARDYWRAETAKLFPLQSQAPPSPVEQKEG